MLIDIMALSCAFGVGWWCGQKYETPKACWEAIKAAFK
jgi:hypothetical protein